MTITTVNLLSKLSIDRHTTIGVRNMSSIFNYSVFMIVIFFRPEQNKTLVVCSRIGISILTHTQEVARSIFIHEFIIRTHRTLELTFIVVKISSCASLDSGAFFQAFFIRRETLRVQVDIVTLTGLTPGHAECIGC